MVLAIYGSGGVGRELVDLAEDANRITKEWERIIFIDDITEEKMVYGIPVYTFQEVVEDFELRTQVEVVVALGTPTSREDLYNKVKDYGFPLGRIISPKASISHSAKIGEGTVIHNATVSSNVSIGDNCYIGDRSVIGHDTQIGDHTMVIGLAAICGKCTIGNRVFIGPSASICDGITIEDDCLVAMSAALFKSMEKESKAMGNPAVISARKMNNPLFRNKR